MDENKKSVYRVSAECGPKMAPLLLGALVCIGASAMHSWCALPGLLFMVAVPVFVWRSMYRTLRDDPQAAFSTLWLQGICTFFFGALFIAPVMYASLRWFWPNYISDQVSALISLYSSAPEPEMKQMADALSRAVSQNGLPGAAHMTLEMIYAIVVSGMMGSLALSFCLHTLGRKGLAHNS